MVWQYVAAASAAVVGYKLLDHVSTSSHDRTVKRTYKTLSRAAPADATVYADHITPGPNPESTVEGITGIPDVVVTSVEGNNLIIEVETAESLQERSAQVHEQLAGFGKRGYTRVLVVPDSNHALAAGTSFLERRDDDLADSIQLATPRTVTEVLSP